MYGKVMFIEKLEVVNCFKHVNFILTLCKLFHYSHVYGINSVYFTWSCAQVDSCNPLEVRLLD